ncbi:MAG: hypothetical protein L0271_16180 [Gemmatimonadetes bacterium]|nr:hypothetical protein [Gemmatimonadota bacterium]
MRSMLLVIGLSLAFMGGCSTRAPRPAPGAPTVLEVENQTVYDMTIYVIRFGGSRDRLGTVTAHTTDWFTIPERLLFGLTPLRFQADPIGVTAASVTREITVEPGDTVVLTLPPR